MSQARRTVSIMLAGGKGSRLHELTAQQCKPALPFGSGGRIADWTLNCLARAGISDLIVATQYCPTLLERHLHRRWSATFGRLSIRTGRTFGTRGIGYLGTADAVRRNLDDAAASGAKDVLIVAADHIMDMDFTPMIAAHRASGAGITVACTLARRAEARSFGVMLSDAENRVSAFVEKSPHPPEAPDVPGHCLVSMGIYICRRHWLEEALAAGGHDFGHDILPWAVERGEAACHRAVSRSGRPVFWNDVGTLDAYRRVSVELILHPSRCAVHVPHALRTSPEQVYWALGGNVVMPGATVAAGADLHNVIVAPGARIPAHLSIGRSAKYDRRRFRVTSAGTTLVTPEMLESLPARSRSINIPMPTRNEHGAAGAAV